MLRSEIIAEVYKLLNETSTGTWDDAELYLFARAKERELVRILQDKYSRAYRDDFPLSSELAISYMTDGEAYALPTANGFVREVGVFTNNKDWATEVNFKDLDTYKFNDFLPTQADSIYWFEEQGIGVSPKKVASPDDFNYTLTYLKEPDAWTTANVVDTPTAPLIHDDAHQLLVWGTTQLALEDDSELVSASTYEKKFYEGAKTLGVNRKFVSPKEVKKQ